MTPREIERLVAETGGHLCGRTTRHEDGSLVMLQPTKMPSHVAGVAASFLLATVSSAIAQSGPSPAVSQSGDPETSASQPGTTGALTGTVTDIDGALVVGATVNLVKGTATAVSTRTDSSGRFVMSAPAGQYQLQIASQGFVPFSKPLSVEPEGGIVGDATLKPGAEIDVKVTAELSTDSTTMGVLVATYGPWYKRLEFHLRHPVLSLKQLFHRY